MFNMIYSILGILGGILCACGDMLLDLKGKDNKELGEYKLINSGWDHMKEWRFKASIMLVSFGVPFYILGGISLGNQIMPSNETLGMVLKYSIIFGGVGGYFIHVLICLFPLIYKKINNFDLADKVLNMTWDTIKLPFIVYYIILVLVSSVIVVWAIIVGYLQVPIWMVVLNPTVLLIVGVILRKLKHDWFYDLPGIIMPSMGLAMYGLIGIINLLK